MPTGTADGPLLAERYRVVERLGSGGMAAVYLARDERLDRLVAVKRLHASSDSDMDALRFGREAKIGASLSHPNLVSIFDTEQDDESVLLVMEYIDGETLGDLLARGPVEPRRAVKIVCAVAEALDYAHANGIVHRDIKPGNVLLGKDGSVKLADLGIAKAVDHTEITGTGIVLGTPAYMAPEQLDGGELGPKVDIYALATMAFEMFTGRKARTGRSAVEIAHQVVSEPPPDPRDFSDVVPAPAARAIRAGMARDPDERPGTAGELAEMLARCMRAETTAPTRPVASVNQGARPRGAGRAPAYQGARPRGTPATAAGRPSWLLAVLGLFGLALAAVVIGLTSGGGEETQKADKPAKAERQKDDGKAQQSAPAEPAQESSAPVAATGAVPQPSGQGTVAEAHSLHSQGHRELLAGKYDRAIELNTQSIEAFPAGTTGATDIQYAYALFSLGKALRLAGRPEEAIPVLELRLETPDQTATVQQELEAAQAAAGE